MYTIQSHFENQNKPFTVERRFNDFVWLQNKLEVIHLDLLIPPVPEKQILALSEVEEDVVKYRINTLKQFVEKISKMEVVTKNKIVKSFLIGSEQDFEATMKQGENFFGSAFTKAVDIKDGFSAEGGEAKSEDEILRQYYQNLVDSFLAVKNAFAPCKEIYRRKANVQKTMGIFLAPKNVVVFRLYKDDKDIADFMQFGLMLRKMAKNNRIKNAMETELFEYIITDQPLLTKGCLRILANRGNALKNHSIAKARLEQQYSGEAFTIKQKIETERYEQFVKTISDQTSEFKIARRKTIITSLKNLAKANIDALEKNIELWKEFGEKIK